jgi:hypothetical protein
LLGAPVVVHLLGVVVHRVLAISCATEHEAFLDP